jgi:hypothetical protein
MRDAQIEHVMWQQVQQSWKPNHHAVSKPHNTTVSLKCYQIVQDDKETVAEIYNQKARYHRSAETQRSFMMVTVSCPADRLHVRITYGRLKGLCKRGSKWG